MTQRYPLAWPEGWPRTPAAKRQAASFRMGVESTKQVRLQDGSYGSVPTKKDIKVNMARAAERLELEIDRLGARDAILSTNVELRLNGQPRSDRADPTDTGIAVYFTLQGKNRVLACDRWDRVADNIAAVASHIDALRRIERYGVGTIEQAFRGYDALPAPDRINGRTWRQVLLMTDVNEPRVSLLALAETVYRKFMKEIPQDTANQVEVHRRQVELNQAIAEARKELSPQEVR